MNTQTSNLGVAVPFYNDAPYLAKAVQALANQTLPLEQIVLSNNHSTDPSGQLIQHLAPKMSLVTPQEHLPMFAHFNFAVKQLSSEWTSIVCGDDEPTSGFSRILLPRHLPHDAVLIRAGLAYRSESTESVRKSRLLTVPRVQRWPGNFLNQFSGPRVAFPAFAVRRTAFEAVGGFDQAFNLAGDWDLWLRLAPLGSFVRVPRIASRYRVGHRPAQQRARLIHWIQDFVRIYTVTIPNVLGSGADSGHLAHHVRVRADRKLRPLLVEARRILDPDGCRQVEDLVRQVWEYWGQPRTGRAARRFEW